MVSQMSPVCRRKTTIKNRNVNIRGKKFNDLTISGKHTSKGSKSMRRKNVFTHSSTRQEVISLKYHNQALQNTATPFNRSQVLYYELL